MKILIGGDILYQFLMGYDQREDILILFSWLNKIKYKKLIHPASIMQIISLVGLKAFNEIGGKFPDLTIMNKISANKHPLIQENEILEKLALGKITTKIKTFNNNSKYYLSLLNELLLSNVDYIITEDNGFYEEATKFNLEDKIFGIDSFIEKIYIDHPELAKQRDLKLKRYKFKEISLNDVFFDSFKKDYEGFTEWFKRKAEEPAFATIEDGRIVSFLYLKTENENEDYQDIMPIFTPKKRLKISSFKVKANGRKISERFLKIIFDKAITSSVDEIYVTIFNNNNERRRLIRLLEDWGFHFYGYKKKKEFVYVKSINQDFTPKLITHQFPFIYNIPSAFIFPIPGYYMKTLLPDEYLEVNSNDSKFIETEPFKNAIKKVLITRKLNRNLKKGSVLFFYNKKDSTYESNTISAIGVVEDIITNIKDEFDFIIKCRKRSILTDNELRFLWNYDNDTKPIIIKFLYNYALKGDIITEDLLTNMGINSNKFKDQEPFQLTNEQTAKFISICKRNNVNIFKI